MLKMADGPPSNLPPGMDAYGGYVNMSGIGITFPQVQILAKAQGAVAFSITTNGSPAQCADVESGAMSDWSGYDYGYCSVSRVNELVGRFGRPRRLWTAHYNPLLGAHICSPACWPGLVTSADGTQWVDHGGWDESLLNDDFFATPQPPLPQEEDMNLYTTNAAGTGFVVAADLSSKIGMPDAADAQALLETGLYKNVKLTDQLINSIPNA